MTSNWHRRFWRILSSICCSPDFRATEISAYMKLSTLSCLAIHCIFEGFFFSQLSFVTDITILSSLPPLTLHCAAEQTVVVFVALTAGPCLKCTQQFSLVCWVQINRRVLGSERTASSYWYLLTWSFLLYPKYDWVFLKSERVEKERTALRE